MADPGQEESDGSIDTDISITSIVGEEERDGFINTDVSAIPIVGEEERNRIIEQWKQTSGMWAKETIPTVDNERIGMWAKETIPTVEKERIGMREEIMRMTEEEIPMVGKKKDRMPKEIKGIVLKEERDGIMKEREPKHFTTPPVETLKHRAVFGMEDPSGLVVKPRPACRRCRRMRSICLVDKEVSQCTNCIEAGLDPWECVFPIRYEPNNDPLLRVPKIEPFDLGPVPHPDKNALDRDDKAFVHTAAKSSSGGREYPWEDSQPVLVDYHEYNHKPLEAVPSNETTDALAQTADLLKSVENWHGLEPESFGDLRLFGTLCVSYSKISWQNLEAFLFSEELILTKKKTQQSQSESLESTPDSFRRLKGIILIKKHLVNVTTSPPGEDMVLTLHLSTDKLPRLHLLFQHHEQLEIWKQALINSKENGKASSIAVVQERRASSHGYRFKVRANRGSNTRMGIYVCDYCHRIFRRKYDILRHLRSSHHLDQLSEYPGDVLGASPDTLEDEADDLESSIFDRDDASKTTYPTTAEVSSPKKKGEHNTMSVERLIVDAQEPKAMESHDESDSIADRNDVTDAETIYSVASVSHDYAIGHLKALCDQIKEDLPEFFWNTSHSNMSLRHLEEEIRTFSRKLHGESTNPFQWEASVIIHRKRREIVNLLSDAEQFEGVESESGSSSDEEGVRRKAFLKPDDFTLEWLQNLGESAESREEDDQIDSVSQVWDDEDVDFALSDYKELVCGSRAYQWLLSRIRQRNHLNTANSDRMAKISSMVNGHLQEANQTRKMSRRRPSPAMCMSFDLDWNPVRAFREHGVDPALPDILEMTLTLTGTSYNAQAMTVMEYMAQTWPDSWMPVTTLLRSLLAFPEGKEVVYEGDQAVQNEGHQPGQPSAARTSLRAKITADDTCSISVTGIACVISEIAEQLGWLGATLRCVPVSVTEKGVMICTPVVDNFRKSPGERWSCDFKFNLSTAAPDRREGLCWAGLFRNPILVAGYPIRSRPEANTGLEISLAVISQLISSSWVVLWQEHIIIKGFNALMVLTRAGSGLMTWHLLTSECSEERISFVEKGLEGLSCKLPENFSSLALERSRHVVGWCSEATDWCGHRTSNLQVGSSGLKKPPASIVIDRLYLEAGSSVVGGLNMSFNKKQHPFWLHRESDYPSLLKWVSLQPIIFYDVHSRRGWLVDGASALLHLVRISLHADEGDPDSPYDWVFDASKLKDDWGACLGRSAAMKTLKNWDNLAMSLYVTNKEVRNGETVVEYATLRSRVEKVLHSLEILIDRQIKVASEDGIKIPQTFDLHRTITGFDVLDVVSPTGPVSPRIQPLNFWGPGWKDIVSPMGITTIFGRDFGELIRPDEASSVCRNWATVPHDQDYLAASVATIRMLHDNRLIRTWPGLGIGDMTAQIKWFSSSVPLKPCLCVGKNDQSITHVDPVQSLISNEARSMLFGSAIISRILNPVDLTKLDPRGAVVFGAVSPLSLGRHRSRKSDEEHESGAEVNPASAHVSDSGLDTSVVNSVTESSSLTAASTVSTGATSYTPEPSASQEQLGDNSKERKMRRGNWFKRTWDKL